MGVDWERPASFRRKQELEELSHRGKSKRERYEEAGDALTDIAQRDPELQQKAEEDAQHFYDKADREAED